MAEPDVILSEQMYADALARLTTAETERDYQQAQADVWRDRAFAAKDVLKTANDNCERLDGERAAAEARVEAAERALAQIRSYRRIPGRGMHSDMEEMRAIARAALACPPPESSR